MGNGERAEGARPRRRIGTRRKVLFSGAILLTLLLAIEGGARLLGAKPFPPNPYRDTDLEMEWELRPSAETVWSNDQLVKTNSLGFRSPELPTVKAPNEKRILFLGDSVVFGYRVAQDETVTRYMEDDLAARAPGAKWHVINAAAEGYNQFSYHHLLRHRGLAAKPDLILVSFVLNDIYEPYLNMRRYGASGYFGKRTFLTPLKDLVRHSAAFCAIESVYIRFQLKSIAPPGVYQIGNMFIDPPPPEIAEGWREALSHLVATRDLAREKGIPLVVVAFPTRYQFESADPARLAPQKRLLEFCEANGIALLDVYTELRANPMPVDDLLLDEIHLRPAGAEHIAGIITERLAESNAAALTPNAEFEATQAWRTRARETLREAGLTD